MLTPEVAPGNRVALDDIDLFDPARFSAGSQHPAWHTLRAEAPLWRQRSADGTEFCSVTRYEDVLAVIKNSQDFSSEYGTILAVLGGDSAAGRTINLMDPPRHGRIRGSTMPMLSTGPVLRSAGRVRASSSFSPTDSPMSSAWTSRSRGSSRTRSCTRVLWPLPARPMKPFRTSARPSSIAWPSSRHAGSCAMACPCVPRSTSWATWPANRKKQNVHDGQPPQRTHG